MAAFAERGMLDLTSTPKITGFPTDPTHGLSWSLDLLGNWSGGDAVNGSVIDYKADETPGFGGEFVNRRDHHNTEPNNSILDRTIDNGTPVVFEYDDAGSLTNDGAYTYTYDVFSRLISVTRISDGELLSAYRYDAFGR